MAPATTTTTIYGLNLRSIRQLAAEVIGQAKIAQGLSTGIGVSIAQRVLAE